jgi:hypothetical protein
MVPNAILGLVGAVFKDLVGRAVPYSSQRNAGKRRPLEVD